MANRPTAYEISEAICGHLFTAVQFATMLRDGTARIDPPVVAYDDGNCVNSGACWPSFDLSLEVAGEHVMRIPCWKFAGWGIAAQWGGSRTAWDSSESDGMFRGFRGAKAVCECTDDCPEDCDGEDGCCGWTVEIEGGDNLASTISIPAGTTSQAEAEAAAEAIDEALRDAYNSVHIDEPDWEPDRDDVRRQDYEWIARDLDVWIGPAVHEIIRDGERPEGDWYGPGVAWLVGGLPSLAEERYENREDAMRAARGALADDIAGLDGLRYVEVTRAHAREAGACTVEIERVEAIIRQRYDLAEDDAVTAEQVLAIMPDSDIARAACAIAAME